jgi:hypothetical protein
MGEGAGGIAGYEDAFEGWVVSGRIGVEEDDHVRLLHLSGQLGRQLMHSAERQAREQICNTVRHAVVGAQAVADRDN